MASTSSVPKKEKKPDKERFPDRLSIQANEENNVVTGLWDDITIQIIQIYGVSHTPNSKHGYGNLLFVILVKNFFLNQIKNKTALAESTVYENVNRFLECHGSRDVQLMGFRDVGMFFFLGFRQLKLSVLFFGKTLLVGDSCPRQSNHNTFYYHCLVGSTTNKSLSPNYTQICTRGLGRGWFFFEKNKKRRKKEV